MRIPHPSGDRPSDFLVSLVQCEEQSRVSFLDPDLRVGSDIEHQFHNGQVLFASGYVESRPT